MSSIETMIVRDWAKINKVEKPSVKLQMLAIEQDCGAFPLINKPCKKAREYVKKNHPGMYEIWDKIRSRNKGGAR